MAVDTFEEYVAEIKNDDSQPEFVTKDLMYMVAMVTYNASKLCNDKLKHKDPDLEIYGWRIMRGCANILNKLELHAGYASIADTIVPISSDVTDHQNILLTATTELTRHMLNVYERNYCSDIYVINDYEINEIYACMDLIMSAMVCVIWQLHSGYNMNDHDEVFTDMMFHSLQSKIY